MKAVVVFTDGVGDHLMTLPAVRALATLFPDQLHVMCEGRLSHLLYGDLPLAGVVAGRLPEMKRIPAALAACDVLISLNDWNSTAFDCAVERLRPQTTIGFDRGMTMRLPFNPRRHAAEMAFDVVRALRPDLSLHDFAWPLPLPRACDREAARTLAVIPRSSRILAVHAETSPRKCIPRSAWRQILRGFLKSAPDDWRVLVLGLGDEGLARSDAHHRIVSCHGLPLGPTFALIKRADLFVGIDSSMLHAADIQKVPGVGLFGPTDPSRWGFAFARHEHVHVRSSWQGADSAAAVRALGRLARNTGGRSGRTEPATQRRLEKLRLNSERQHGRIAP